MVLLLELLNRHPNCAATPLNAHSAIWRTPSTTWARGLPLLVAVSTSLVVVSRSRKCATASAAARHAPEASQELLQVPAASTAARHIPEVSKELLQVPGLSADADERSSEELHLASWVHSAGEMWSSDSALAPIREALWALPSSSVGR